MKGRWRWAGATLALALALAQVPIEAHSEVLVVAPPLNVDGYGLLSGFPDVELVIKPLDVLYDLVTFGDPYGHDLAIVPQSWVYSLFDHTSVEDLSYLCMQFTVHEVTTYFCGYTAVGALWPYEDGLVVVALRSGEGDREARDSVLTRITSRPPSLVARWEPASTPGFEESGIYSAMPVVVYHDWLFAVASQQGGQGQVWSSPDGADWRRTGHEMTADSANAGPFPKVKLFGELLAEVSNFQSGAEVWAFSEGHGWGRMASGGFGNADNTGVFLGDIFHGDLYAGTANQVTGAEVWRALFPYYDEWELVGSHGLGDESVFLIESPVSFMDSLYVVAISQESGNALWCYTSDEEWLRIDDGEFSLAIHAGVTVPFEFAGHLYVGTANPGEGGEVWRSVDGEDWKRVASGGLGNPANAAISPCASHAGFLYAGTTNQESGGEIWRSADGTHWEQVGKGGFGDKNNVVVASLVPFAGTLFAGATNMQGASIWRAVFESSDVVH